MTVYLVKCEICDLPPPQLAQALGATGARYDLPVSVPFTGLTSGFTGYVDVNTGLTATAHFPDTTRFIVGEVVVSPALPIATTILSNSGSVLTFSNTKTRSIVSNTAKLALIAQSISLGQKVQIELSNIVALPDTSGPPASSAEWKAAVALTLGQIGNTGSIVAVGCENEEDDTLLTQTPQQYLQQLHDLGDVVHGLGLKYMNGGLTEFGLNILYWLSLWFMPDGVTPNTHTNRVKADVFAADAFNASGNDFVQVNLPNTCNTGAAVLFNVVAIFNGTIVGTTLTVNSLTSGVIASSNNIAAPGVIAGTTIISGSGNTWTVDTAQNVGPVNMSLGTGATTPYLKMQRAIVFLADYITNNMDYANAHWIGTTQPSSKGAALRWYQALTGKPLAVNAAATFSRSGGDVAVVLMELALLGVGIVGWYTQDTAKRGVALTGNGGVLRASGKAFSDFITASTGRILAGAPAFTPTICP